MSGRAATASPAVRLVRSPALGIVAVVLAVQSVSTLLSPNPVTNLLITLGGRSEAVQMIAVLGLVTLVGLAAVVVGLFAAVTGRGRWWGVTAIALAVVGNIQFLELVRSLVGQVG
jgi:hypothetical protein